MHLLFCEKVRNFTAYFICNWSGTVLICWGTFDIGSCHTSQNEKFKCVLKIPAHFRLLTHDK